MPDDFNDLNEMNFLEGVNAFQSARMGAFWEDMLALLRGQKLAAYRADVGDKNERYTNVFLRPNGDRIGVRQLAGLIARRVVSYLGKGDRRQRGELMGVIKFGSRVDLYVPASYEILVKKGDRVRVGETPMARDSSAATPGTR